MTDASLTDGMPPGASRREGGVDTGDDDTALEELRIAYARGDLSDEGFERRRERLRREE